MNYFIFYIYRPKSLICVYNQQLIPQHNGPLVQSYGNRSEAIRQIGAGVHGTHSLVYPLAAEGGSEALILLQVGEGAVKLHGFSR